MVHGIINIHKEKGYTSHDVVAKLRGIIGQRKIGHTGTLDPDAVGVLPVCLGKATKLCDMLTDKSKVYETVLLLGQATDTQDISGTIIEEYDTGHLTEVEVRGCIQDFIGSYSQVPPMYSAIKIDGKKLYELAREGKEVERRPREVTIYDIQILGVDLPRVRMEVSCSKGTYIRTLCHDIGSRLKCGGCMEELIRIRVDRFELNESCTLSEVEKVKAAGRLERLILPIDSMFEEYPKIHLTGDALKRVYNGNTFRLETIEQKIVDKERVRVYNDNSDFVALYEYQQEESNFKILKMFFDKHEMT